METRPHQSVVLPAEDRLVMELHAPKVLRYRESAQAVARVVEISGSESRAHHNNQRAKNHVDSIWLGSVRAHVCVCVSRWCGTDLPGLSSRPPVGFWQHRRMYSCKACCSNIHRCWLSSDSPAWQRKSGQERSTPSRDSEVIGAVETTLPSLNKALWRRGSSPACQKE